MNNTILECTMCERQGLYGKKEIVVITDSCKTIYLCYDCFLIHLKQFVKDRTELVRTDYRIYTNDIDNSMSFKQFTRFYFIDYILELKTMKGQVNVYV